MVQGDPKPSATVSAEEIAKVKAGWEEKQKKKQEREKELTKEKDSKSGEREGLNSPKLPSSLSISPSPSGTPKSTHDRYTLHRDFFAS